MTSAATTIPTMPTSPMLMTAEELRRAVELAEQHHMTHAAHYQGVTPQGWHLWTTPSEHDFWQVYIQLHDEATGAWSCTCPAGTHKRLGARSCKHVGAAMLSNRTRLQALAQARRRAAWAYRDMLDWDYPAF